MFYGNAVSFNLKSVKECAPPEFRRPNLREILNQMVLVHQKTEHLGESLPKK